MPRLRRFIALTLATAATGCGELPLGDNCDAFVDGVAFANRPAEYIPLAPGETRSYSVIVGPASFHYPTCEGSPPPFGHLQWATVAIGRGAQIRARLASCEACTLLYEDEVTPAAGFTGRAGAATLQAPSQRVVFEVTGVSAGVVTFEVSACAASDADCTQPTVDALTFRVGP